MTAPEDSKFNRFISHRNFRVWLAIIGVSTIIIGGSYTMVQQSTRLSANDQPIALAQKIAHGGVSAVPAYNVNLATDNNVFAIITDSAGTVLASSATLDGQTPLPPKGVLKFALAHSDNKITWEPKTGVRLATYVLTESTLQYPTKFIITGQSLKPYEERINTYSSLALFAWMTAFIWTSFVLFGKILFH